MTFIVRAAVIASAVALSLPAAAAPAKQLINKSVKVSYTVNLITKAPSGTIYNTSFAVTGAGYVSSSGRVFIQGTRTDARKGAETVRVGPGENYKGLKTSVTANGNVVRFIQSSVGGSGAVQVTVTVDPATYSSCTVNVVYGLSGKQKASYPGINEPGPYEMQSYSIANNSCSVVNGNIFGD
ncbi:MAG: hypothetical protein A4S14_10555 [Proteobacteria bacterium SG_bin9]|nr:MAG: hypothetical protein A4S14_10555 [Proteobacteria bacterium SG_bin9]